VLTATILCLTGIALWLAYLFQAERRSTERDRRQIHLLNDMIATLTGSDWQRSLDDFLHAIVKTEAARSAILLVLTDHGHLECRSAVETPGAPGWDATLAAGARQALERRTLISVADDLFLPVTVDGEVVGVLALRGAAADPVVWQTAARLAALCINGLKFFQRQSVLSNTDGLTGLANHRQFQQLLSVGLGQAYIEGEPLALILLDFDHFKLANDTYGHLFGDMVLREVASLLRQGLPPGTMVARYGGEEMAILLQGQLASSAAAVAERLRQAVEGHEVFDFATGTRHRVTISLGVASYELGQGKSRLIARADEALYTSKRNGRNRVTVAEQESSTSTPFLA
jgi:diguanylate cyclase (GGDEF)-like protein